MNNRANGGRTLCNKLFREAVKARKDELKEEISKEENEEKRSVLTGKLSAIATKRISEGPLYFGLRFVCV